MVEPMRIRARNRDGLTEVHVLIPHPMETGLRRDEQGRLVDAHYITDVRIAVDGRPALAVRMGIAVSQDPLLTFHIKDARTGERVTVAWTDNRGERGTGQALIT